MTFFAIAIALVIDAHLGGATTVRVLARLEAVVMATSAKFALAVLAALAEIVTTLQLVELEEYSLVMAELALVVKLAITIQSKEVSARGDGPFVRLALLDKLG